MNIAKIPWQGRRSVPERLPIIYIFSFFFRAKAQLTGSTHIYTHKCLMLFHLEITANLLLMSMGRWSNLLLGRGNALQVEKLKCTCSFHFSFWLFVNVMSEVMSSVPLHRSVYHFSFLYVQVYLKYAHFQADFAVTENSSETSVNRNRSRISDVLVFCDLQCAGSERK